MWPFKKKSSDSAAPAPISENTDSEEAEDDAKPQVKAPSEQSGSSANSGAELIKLQTDLDKVKASVESFGEVRKGMTERISGLGEQIGELRAMILDRDRTIQEIELKSVKAADLVESVQPDKLMIEIQKEDAKFEALKASLEGNEAILSRVMDELKEMRKKVEFFRGIEEIIKLSEEVRKELVDIKKVEASIHIDTDKVQTIYGELRKKFQEIDIFNDSLQEIKATTDQNTKDSEFIKGKISGLATKDELDRLVQKVQRYVDALQEIDKSSSLSKDIKQLKTILDGLK